MIKARFAVAASVAAMVSACGGGGAGDTSAPIQVTPPLASLPVTLSASSADVNVAEGQTADFGFKANYSGSSTQPIVADVAVGADRYQLVGTPTASGTSFDVALRTLPLPVGGKTTSNVTFRLCTSAACSTVYPGSTQTFTVNLDVQLKDWSTFQRDSAHTGYVAVNYNAAKFADAWTVATAQPAKGIAARRGSVFFNNVLGSGRLVTRAVNSATGQQQWETDIGTGAYFSAPSYANGRVASMAMDLSSDQIPLLILRAGDGSVQGTASYASQFSNGGTPTPFGDMLFFQAGYYGNVVYGANALSGARLWATDGSGPTGGIVQEGANVAVDDNSVYFFRGGAMVIINRASGAITSQIANPYFTSGGVSYYGTDAGGPLLDGNGRIVTFTGNRESTTPVPLMGLAVGKAEPLWRTTASYVGHPALRDGRVYAIRSGTAIVDMIDPASGSVVGSIDLGSDKGQLNSNIVLTGSHLFVASDSATYAVDLKAVTPTIVWTAPRGGKLAITPDNLLVVTASTGLFAYRLA